MKITLLTYGSRGDVQPYLALGRGLKRAGHAVRIAAPGVFADFAAGHGLDFAALPGDPAELVRRLVEEGRGKPLRTMRVVYDFAMPLGMEVFSACIDACRDADVVIHSFLLTLAGHEAARQFGVPDVSTQLYPIFTRTGAFPSPGFPPLPLGAAYNRLTHDAFTAAFWHGNRLGYGVLRRSHPELPALRGWPFDGRRERVTPLLYAFSPHVIPPDPAWGDHVHVTGYWFLDAPDWEPPADLAGFLAAGPPPVYIGFGSTLAKEMEHLAGVALDALARSGQRGIVSAGWAGLGKGVDRRPDAYLLDAAPHDWLFPRMVAVVHHGGAGTTAAGLRAGVPSILTPFSSDQPWWARRVYQLGVGPPPIPHRRLTAENLAAAIRIALTDPAIRDRAAALGEAIRAEDGVARAVELVEQIARR